MLHLTNYTCTNYTSYNSHTNYTIRIDNYDLHMRL
jgi:hypothetical protein